MEGRRSGFIVVEALMSTEPDPGIEERRECERELEREREGVAESSNSASGDWVTNSREADIAGMGAKETPRPRELVERRDWMPVDWRSSFGFVKVDGVGVVPFASAA